MATRGKVLIVGDSISIGYTPTVAERLDGEFLVAHHEGNCGDSGVVRERLEGWLAADADAGTVHLNVGLHDLRVWHDERGYQVPIEKYRDNLTEIVGLLKTTSKTVLWATTTPVVDERVAERVPDFVRRNQDVEAYNQVSREIVSAAGIPVNDLYAVVEGAGREALITPDGTHFTEEGYRLLGRAVADFIREHAPA